MTLPELRTIYSQMRAINPLLDELHKRFELGTPESGTKNLGNDRVCKNIPNRAPSDEVAR